MHSALRLLILVTLVLVAAFGCANNGATRVKGGGSSQEFPASDNFGMPAPADASEPASAPAVRQSLAQPENPEGESRQKMSEERTEVRPDGTVIRTVRHASTELGGSQDLAEILKEYAGTEYTRRLLLALLLGAVAWTARREWPVAAGLLAAGAVATAFGSG